MAARVVRRAVYHDALRAAVFRVGPNGPFYSPLISITTVMASIFR